MSHFKGGNGSDANSDRPGKRKALIVGVSEYSKASGLQALPFCVNDGHAIYEVLKSQGYETLEKWTLIGRVPGNKLRKAIIDFFFKSAETDDTLFFYFSGHGVPDGYGDHFLASSDIDGRIPDENGFDFADLESALKKSPARKIVVALDCCFSGAAGSGKGGVDLATRARGTMEKVFGEGSGRCLLASSLDGQSSFAMDDNKYSRFTYYLLLGLKGGNEMAVNNNGFVTPFTLSNYIYNNIPFLNEQKPITKTAMSGEIIIASYPDLAKPSEADARRFESLYQLLRDGYVTQFNLARKAFVDLHGSDLQRKDLKGANLSNCNLSGVNLREANLQGADLSNSDLAGARLEFVDLRNAKLAGAKLDSASLDYTLIHGAEISNRDDPVFALADFRDLADHVYARDSKSIFDLSAVPARMVEVRGYKVRYLAYESPIDSRVSEPTIMLHGLAGLADTWLLMMPSLTRYLRVLVPDMIGFGYSDKPDVKYDLDFFMDFIKEFLGRLSLKKVNIVGMSFGARLATEFAIRYPQMLNRLVLCSPAFVPRLFNCEAFANSVFKMDYKGFFQTFVDDNFLEGDSDSGHVIETSARLFAEMLKQPDLRHSYQSSLCELLKYPEVKGRLSSIVAPTLVVWGDKDKISSVSNAEQFRAIPEAKFVIVKECGHYVCIQKPVEFSKAILSHLRSS